MRKNKTIKINNRDINVEELTASQIYGMLSNLNEKRAVHPTELLLDAVIPVEAVVLATGMTTAELGGNDCDYTPSELDEIWQAVAEVNDFLCRLMVKLAGAGHALLSGKNSAEPAAE